MAANDISTVQVANDDLGNITFTIAVTNYAYFVAGDSLSIFLDTDQNLATGSSGSDYVIGLSGTTNKISLARWTGATWDQTTPQTTLSGSTYYGAVIHVNRAELGGTPAFNFWAGTAYIAAAGAEYDFAPPVGWWTHAVIIAPPVVVAPVVVTPAPVAPAPAQPTPAAAEVVIDTTLSIAAAKASVRAFVKRKLKGAPSYSKLTCSKDGFDQAICPVSFKRGVFTYSGSSVVQNYAYAGEVVTDVAVRVKRTDTACVKRRKAQHKSTKVCVRSFDW